MVGFTDSGGGGKKTEGSDIGTMRELPLVIDIKRYSFEDGPGIRSVVFFKGCPLKCVFCHNPEEQESAPEIAFSTRNALNVAHAFRDSHRRQSISSNLGEFAEIVQPVWQVCGVLSD